jgi:hypothetical protein
VQLDKPLVPRPLPQEMTNRVVQPEDALSEIEIEQE